MKPHLPLTVLGVLFSLSSLASGQTPIVAEGVDYQTILDVSKGTSRFDTSERFYDAGKGWYWVQKDAGGHDGIMIYLDYKGNFEFLEELYAYIPEEYSSRQYTLNGAYNYDAMRNLTQDSDLCWAYSASNGIQYWQSYYGVFYKGTEKLAYGYTYSDTAPWGGDGDKRYWLAGTQYTEVSMAIYDTFQNYGGYSSRAHTWYLQGYTVARVKEGAKDGGYFKEYFGDSTCYASRDFGAYSDEHIGLLTDQLASALGYTKNETGEYERTVKGVIGQLDIITKNGGAHSISLYGMDVDENGHVCALYLADSDDFNLHLRKSNLVYMTHNGRTAYYLITGEYSEYGKYDYITDVTWIQTPQVLQDMLAEYEKNDLTWTGKADSWADTSSAATLEELPTEETGWAIKAGVGTDHEDYYAAYYGNERGVRFDDSTANPTVTLAENLTVPSMTVDNNQQAYCFMGNGQSITTEGFIKSGTQTAEFDGVTLNVTGTAQLKGGVLKLYNNAMLKVGADTVYSLTNKSSGGASLSNLILAENVISGESTAVAGMLSNVALTLAEGQSLSLCNLTVDAQSVINGGAGATLNVENVTIMLGAENTFTADVPMLLSMEMQSISLDTMVLSCTALDGLTLTGDGLLFDLSGLDANLLADLKNVDSVSLTLGDGVNLSGVNNLNVTLDGINNITATADLTDLTFMVPEPSAAMLSMVALAAFALRRRRNRGWTVHS